MAENKKDFKKYTQYAIYTNNFEITTYNSTLTLLKYVNECEIDSENDINTFSRNKKTVQKIVIGVDSDKRQSEVISDNFKLKSLLIELITNNIDKFKDFILCTNCNTQLDTFDLEKENGLICADCLLDIQEEKARIAKAEQEEKDRLAKIEFLKEQKAKAVAEFYTSPRQISRIISGLTLQFKAEPITEFIRDKDNYENITGIKVKPIVKIYDGNGNSYGEIVPMMNESLKTGENKEIIVEKYIGFGLATFTSLKGLTPTMKKAIGEWIESSQAELNLLFIEKAPLQLTNG